MKDIYRSLPPEYRLSENPMEMVTLWRGDKIGREATGMICRLGDITLAEKLVAAAVAGGTSGLDELIDRHTDADEYSPLISVTNAIARAQGYARRGNGETIYELAVPAYRMFGDPYNIGSPRRGNETELFVIGGIEPQDISAIKTNNDVRSASEFVGMSRVGIIDDPTLNPKYRHDPNRKPNPTGVWDRSRHWGKQ